MPLKWEEITKNCISRKKVRPVELKYRTLTPEGSYYLMVTVIPSIHVTAGVPPVADYQWDVQYLIHGPFAPNRLATLQHKNRVLVHSREMIRREINQLKKQAEDMIVTPLARLAEQLSF